MTSFFIVQSQNHLTLLVFKSLSLLPLEDNHNSQVNKNHKISCWNMRNSGIELVLVYIKQYYLSLSDKQIGMYLNSSVNYKNYECRNFDFFSNGLVWYCRSVGCLRCYQPNSNPSTCKQCAFVLLISFHC